MRTTRQLVWLTVAAGAACLPFAATAQQTTPPAGTSGNRDSGVLQPPANVDPGIQAKPRVPSSKLPTKVVPPPGTPGGDPSTVPK